MPCGTLLQTGSYSMTSTRDAERHPYFFYSKTLVNTEKMLESTDFACTLKETKTTIPISRTPKPISGFGLKPGRYRPSAVKVAGFDPLDANHAASTGVGSFPVLDRTCKTDPGGGRPRSRRQHPPDHRRQGRKVIPEPATRPRPSGPTKHGNGDGETNPRPSESLSLSTGHPAHCIVVHHHDALAIAIDEFLRTNARDNVVSGLHGAVECLRQPIHQGVES